MNDMQWWQVLLVLLGIIASWSLIIIAALRVMFGRAFKVIEDKMAEFSKTTTACTKLEREFLEFKADMPLRYVMREDFIRFDVRMNNKLDKLRDLIMETFKPEKMDHFRDLVLEAFKINQESKKQ